MDNWLSSYDGGYSINPYLLHSAATATANVSIAGSFPAQMPNEPVPSTSGAAAVAPEAAQGIMEYCARRKYKTTEQKIVRMYRGEDDDEVMPTTLMRVSLICPVTRKRLVTPARGMSCRHLQCFELQTFVAMNDQSQKWKCGVCRGCAKKERLVVDEYFLKVLEDVDSNVDEVELMEDGSFRAVTAGREHPAGVVPVDIDSAQEDNDDDCLIVGFTPGATPKPARLCPKQELREIVEDLLREGGAAVQEQVRGAEAAAPAQAEESDDSDIIFVEEVQGNPALPPAAPRRQRHVPTSSSSSSDSDDDAHPRYNLRRTPKRRHRKPPNQGSASKRVRSRSFVDSDEDESGDSFLYALNDGSEHEMDVGTENDEDQEEANDDGLPQSDDEEQDEEEGDEASPDQDAEREDDDGDWDLRGSQLEAVRRKSLHRSATTSVPGADRRVTRSRARSSVENEAPQVAAETSGSNVEEAAPSAPMTSSSRSVKTAALQDIPPEIHAQLSQSFGQFIRMGQAAQKRDERATAQRICDRLQNTIQGMHADAVAARPSADAQAATKAHPAAVASSSAEAAIKLAKGLLATVEKMLPDPVGRDQSDPASSTSSGSSSENGRFNDFGGRVTSARDIPGTSSSSAAHGGTGHHCVLCDLGVERSVIMEHLRSLEPEGGILEPSHSAVCASSQSTPGGREEPTELASEVPHSTVQVSGSHGDEPPTKLAKLIDDLFRERPSPTPQGIEEKGALKSDDTVLTAGASLPVPDESRSVPDEGHIQESLPQVATVSTNAASPNVADANVSTTASQQMPSRLNSSMEDEAASE